MYEGNHFLWNARLSSLRLGLVTPEQTKTLTMPVKQCLGFDDQQGLSPSVQSTGQQDKQAAIPRSQGRTFRLATENDELLAQEGILDDQLRLAARGIRDYSKQETAVDRLKPAFDALLKLLSSTGELLNSALCKGR